MFNLVQLFLRLSGFFVFVFLEIICFMMVVKYNQTQQGIYVNSMNRGTGFLQKTTANFRYYFSLDDENYRLSKDNAGFLEMLYNQNIDTATVDTFFYPDSSGPQYIFQVAKVVKNTVNNHHNYITLDKGSDDGIQPHTGVITGDGVVGIVRKVNRRYSVAMSILHRQMRISARVRGGNSPGSLVWDDGEKDAHRFKLMDIPRHAEIAVGDTVETSGFSAIFPEGIMLGTIESVELKAGKHAYEISVGSKIDMTNIQYVYIVKNLFKKEQEDLEEAVMKEDE